MGTLLVIGALVLAAVVALVLLRWRENDAPTQIAEASRIRFEEQLAIWRIQTISRLAKAELQRIREENRPRPVEDLDLQVRPHQSGSAPRSVRGRVRPDDSRTALDRV